MDFVRIFLLLFAIHYSSGMNCYDCESEDEGARKVVTTGTTTTTLRPTLPDGVVVPTAPAQPPTPTEAPPTKANCGPLKKGKKREKELLQTECPGGTQFILCAKMEGTIVTEDPTALTKTTSKVTRRYCITTLEVASWNSTHNIDVAYNGPCLKIPQAHKESDVKICVCDTELCNGGGREGASQIFVLSVLAVIFVRRFQFQSLEI